MPKLFTGIFLSRNLDTIFSEKPSHYARPEEDLNNFLNRPRYLRALGAIAPPLQVRPPPLASRPTFEQEKDVCRGTRTCDGVVSLSSQPALFTYFYGHFRR